MIKISICIATWSRSKKLKDIINLLEHQTMERSEYEIIVVDSMSPDKTYDVMSAYQKKYDNIKYIRDAKNILAAKRNVGIQNAASEIIVFMDDDVYPCKKFVEAHYNANKNNTNTFYCGQIRFPKEKAAVSNYYYFRDQQHLKSSDTGRSLGFNNIVVMNLSFRKSFIRTTGYVDERFIGYGCEDMDFGYRVKHAGYSIKYLPDALAIHMEDSSDISQYGKKLYKTGLYGERALREFRPEAYDKLHKKYDVLAPLLSLNIINKMLEKYLLITDKCIILYNYYLYKAYLYSCLYIGRKSQKDFLPLDEYTAAKGW